MFSAASCELVTSVVTRVSPVMTLSEMQIDKFCQSFQIAIPPSKSPARSPKSDFCDHLSRVIPSVGGISTPKTREVQKTGEAQMMIRKPVVQILPTATVFIMHNQKRTENKKAEDFSSAFFRLLSSPGTSPTN